MRHLILIFITTILFLVGCSQSNVEDKASSDETSSDEIENQLDQHDDLSDQVELEAYQIGNINDLVALFQEVNIDGIANKISFPLSREHPIPVVKDKEELRQRFSEVFDGVLIDKIANAQIHQWAEVGSRGIMLDNGMVWLDNTGGNITAVNYQSDVEKELRDELIANGTASLHASLQSFEKLLYKIETADYLIRIDQLAGYKYRYASWKISESESSKPDLVLTNGELERQGSGGNHMITFLNDVYAYKIHRIVLGEGDSPDAILEVEKDGQVILSQDGTLAN